MTPASARHETSAPWPAEGVLRVHFDPAALPHLGDAPGVNRFDDPRPRTIDRFLTRISTQLVRGKGGQLIS